MNTPLDMEAEIALRKQIGDLRGQLATAVKALDRLTCDVEEYFEDFDTPRTVRTALDAADRVIMNWDDPDWVEQKRADVRDVLRELVEARADYALALEQEQGPLVEFRARLLKAWDHADQVLDSYPR